MWSGVQEESRIDAAASSAAHLQAWCDCEVSAQNPSPRHCETLELSRGAACDDAVTSYAPSSRLARSDEPFNTGDRVRFHSIMEGAGPNSTREQRPRQRGVGLQPQWSRCGSDATTEGTSRVSERRLTHSGARAAKRRRGEKSAGLALDKFSAAYSDRANPTTRTCAFNHRTTVTVTVTANTAIPRVNGHETRRAETVERRCQNEVDSVE